MRVEGKCEGIRVVNKMREEGEERDREVYIHEKKSRRKEDERQEKKKGWIDVER